MSPFVFVMKLCVPRSVSLGGRDAIGEGLGLRSLKQNVELSLCSTAFDCFPECSLASLFVPLVGVVSGLRSSLSVGGTILTGKKGAVERETSHSVTLSTTNITRIKTTFAFRV
jgi:hypothetical protein